MRAKVVFDFIASSPNELQVRTNDEVLLAPTYIQEEMKLINTGWAFAIGNGKSGLIPLNYLVLSTKSNGVLKHSQIQNRNGYLPVPRDITERVYPRSSHKRVSFGEEQIIDSNGTEHVVKIPDVESSPNNKENSSYDKVNDSLCKKESENTADSNTNSSINKGAIESSISDPSFLNVDTFQTQSTEEIEINKNNHNINGVSD